MLQKRPYSVKKRKFALSSSVSIMKGLRYLVILPVLVLLASVAMGIHNYQAAKEEMRRDLTHALRQFVMDESQQQLLSSSIATLHKDMVLTLNDPDNCFCAQLTIPSLKDTSHIALCLIERNSNETFREEALVSSDTLLWNAAHEHLIALKAYANPTYCSILTHSSQRIPLAGIIFCLTMLSVLAFRQDEEKVPTALQPCNPSVASDDIHLTPMQEQLMAMFATAPHHTLTKEAICEALWPKKDHPEDTLYTFICRMKASLKRQSGMDIVNKRGKEYQLIENS